MHAAREIQSKRHRDGRGVGGHLNSDKPFWTRRYYTGRPSRGPFTPRRTIIIYPCAPRPTLYLYIDELTGDTCRCQPVFPSKASES